MDGSFWNSLIGSVHEAAGIDLTGTVPRSVGAAVSMKPRFCVPRKEMGREFSSK